MRWSWLGFSLWPSAYLCGLCVEIDLKLRERRDTQRAAENFFASFHPGGIYCRAIMTAQTELDPKRRDTAFIGHPKGLGPLFFTELWERFCYYGMRAILVLYMVAPPAQGGLGFDGTRAASIYGWYTMSVYITALPGGLAADYLLGARLGAFLGGVVMARGHF